MHSTNAISRLLPSCILSGSDSVSSQVQVLYLPALLHFIPSAMLHDALLVMRRYVGSYQQILQLDLPCKDVNVFQQVLPFALEAALKVCRLCLLALEAALQLFKLLPFLFYLFLG